LDVFISYSRTDTAYASELAELLQSAGLSCWIDQQGIEVATSWSREIVQAIDQCRAMVVLLSHASNNSTNVHKEVALASEKKKKILPLDIEPVQLSEDLQYHLAGVQRAPMTNIDAIIRALEKLGLAPTTTPQAPKIVREEDGKKSLMVLPFEDLSPTRDNEWFVDGMVSELISALSNVKALRVAHNQATKEYKRYQGQLTAYAREMRIRYFVQGDVRKFGDNIKISVRLLDIESGDSLWQDSMKGTMNDIFDIQEKVAEKVVQGLKVHLGTREKKKLHERDTENSEAYELYLKADQYQGRQTREGYALGIRLLSQAIELDPNYTGALRFKAYLLTELYRLYERDPKLLEEAESLSKRALEIRPEFASAFQPLSSVYRMQGKFAEAEAAAKEYIRLDPENAASHFSLAFFYDEIGQPALSLEPYEQAIKVNDENLSSYFNLVISADRAGDRERLLKWARAALPHFEKRLRLSPDDEHAAVAYATLLEYLKERDRALEALAPLTKKADLDGVSLYNVGCIYSRLGDFATAFQVLGRALDVGFSNFELFHNDPDLSPLRSMDEFHALLKRVEALQRG